MTILTTLPPDQLFLTHLAHIERVAAHACRQKGFSREETEDFASTAKCKIIDGDYAIIRKHKGESSLKTYLTVVVRNLFRDYVNHIWRKWRSSEEAKRLGELAIQLEKLFRDGYSFDEACQILWTNHHVEASPQELAELAAKLPHRAPPRRMESEEALENHPSGELAPYDQVSARERADRRQVVLGYLKEILDQLPAEDALLVKMFSSGFKVSVIARRLGLEQKPLYRRLEKILKELRQELQRRGVRPEEIAGLLSIPEDEYEPRE